MSQKRLAWILIIVAIFLPRLIGADYFFIQDEQPWIDRSQTYWNALSSGDFVGAVQYPLSNHPAISLMTVVGPVMNLYGTYHGLQGTYADWPVDDKREAAVWARYAWGIACSIALLALVRVVASMQLFKNSRWAAGLVVVLFGLEPWILGISRTVSVDVLMSIGVVGMLVSAVVAFERKNRLWVCISGAWFALAFISKSPALITAPIALLLASFVPGFSMREMGKRSIAWIGSAYFSMIILWPPFLFHPIQRLIDVLARAELHSTVQEVYYWPGVHPPLFIFTLSAFATIGCLLYIWNRLAEVKQTGWNFFALDIVLLAGVWHGLVLLYLHGDQARKNLPVLALLAFIGAIGWVWVLQRRRVAKPFIVIGLIILQGIFMWPYFPHVISSYNILFPSVGGKRLLVDVGNSSRLIADYINSSNPKEVFAIPMDSLVVPYLDSNKRDAIRGFPSEGYLKNLDPAVTKIIIPMSFPARVNFDPTTKNILKDLASYKPEKTLFIRDIPMFYVYTLHPIEYTLQHETGI